MPGLSRRPQQRPPESQRQDHRSHRQVMGPAMDNSQMQELLRRHQQEQGVGGRAKAPTAKELWQQRYLAQKNQAVDPTIPRWRQLTDEEAAAAALLPEEERPGAGQNGYTAAVNGHQWRYDVQANDPQRPTTRADLMGGSASQFYSRAFVGPNGDHPDREDVTILNRDGTTTVQQGIEHGMAELPASGFGYTTHNRNDVVRSGRPQPDQWGTPANIARDINIMADYRTLFPNSTVSIGDLSTDTGDSPLLYNRGSQRHATHYHGSQTDLQYVAGQESSATPSTSDDNLFRQRSFVRTAENWGMDYFHVSPTFKDQLFFSPGSDVHYNHGHDDHLHMGVGDGGQ